MMAMISHPRSLPLLKYAPYGGAILLLAFLAPLLPSYYLSMVSKVLIFAIFALSLDLVMGYAGLISLGHASFLGLGGYTVGIFMLHLKINNLFIVMSAGVLVSVTAAALVGIVCLRVSGLYFLLITLAFGQLFSVAATKWRTLTGGSDGLIGIDYPVLGLAGFAWNRLSFYYFILILFIGCFFLLSRITHSPFGHVLVGIRENERRMIALGYNTWRYKYMVFILGGLFAGVAGALFAPFYGAMAPDHFAIGTSCFVMLMVVIGSPGTLYGPVIGAALVVLLEQLTSLYSPERWPLILGLVFIFAVLFLRGGIGIHLNRYWQRVIGKLCNV